MCLIPKLVMALAGSVQAKMRQGEEERRRKKKLFLDKLTRMKNMGVTDVLRRLERFVRDRGEA
jgi:hypothetical protein